MTVDPSVIAMLNESSASFRMADCDLSRYLAGIAEKLTEGMDLTADEAALAGLYIHAAAAQAQAGAPDLGQSSEAAAPMASGLTLTITSTQAAALAMELQGATDPDLVAVAQNLAAAQASAGGALV